MYDVSRFFLLRTVAHYVGFVMALRCFIMSAICVGLHIGVEHPASQGDSECPFCSNFSGMLESGIWHGGLYCYVSASVFAAVLTSVFASPLSFCVRLSFSVAIVISPLGTHS